MPQHNPPPPDAARRRRVGSMQLRAGAYELTKRGASRYDLRDPYHLAISLGWGQFALLFLVLNLAINIVFAGLYLAVPGCISNARPGVFSDVFFFSMETLATVGYGAMSPATLYGHSVAAAEIISGVAFTAIMTGLTFVRFSRAKAKILYAERPVVAFYNGRPTLMIRIANGRASTLTDAQARLSALIGEHTQEGQFYRRVHDLTLSRSRIPTFPLTWTLMHEIDAHSPLHGFDASSLAAQRILLFLSVEARDHVLGAVVYDTKDYAAHDIAFGMRYADAVSIDERGNTVADLTRLSLMEPDTGTSFHADAPAHA